MSEQPTFFDYAAKSHARTSDPSTSHDAAERAEPIAQCHAAKIAAYLKRIHPADATADEVSIGTKMPRHSVLKRLPDLEKSGIAKPNGRARTMKSKRKGRCWEWIPQ